MNLLLPRTTTVDPRTGESFTRCELCGMARPDGLVSAALRGGDADLRD